MKVTAAEGFDAWCMIQSLRERLNMRPEYSFAHGIKFKVAYQAFRRGDPCLPWLDSEGNTWAVIIRGNRAYTTVVTFADNEENAHASTDRQHRRAGGGQKGPGN